MRQSKAGRGAPAVTQPAPPLAFSARPGPSQVAHHRLGLPDPLAPAAHGAPPPRVGAPASAPRRTAAERLPPAPPPLPGPTAHARGSGGGADRGRLTAGGADSGRACTPPGRFRLFTRTPSRRKGGVSSPGRRRGLLEGVDTVSLIIKNDLVQKPFLSAKSWWVVRGDDGGKGRTPIIESRLPSLPPVSANGRRGPSALRDELRPAS